MTPAPSSELVEQSCRAESLPAIVTLLLRLRGDDASDEWCSLLVDEPMPVEADAPFKLADGASFAGEAPFTVGAFTVGA
eukprot:CAMPEP_0174726510 /NCGR_PEP_ID=MMETSP1094-20130205/47964_1 /TAXON_ID=156173 /ORGANISM="Chrysochromulina brevifilum, Strain UTEX LB 985" /LENGTH=78 /DNA_ID=CAMNT_0015928103 /DNA_START=26 /DNA_END=258 /DNA_ORIENTATION=-